MADVPAPGPTDSRPYVGIGTLLAGDGVRGVGALFVFTTHVCLLADPVANNNLLSYGWAAPILGHIDLALSAFFVLSGYLIARPYARAYVAGRRRPRLRNYVRNRILRVVPVFYLLTILVLLRFGLDGSLATGAAAPDKTSSAWQVARAVSLHPGPDGRPGVDPDRSRLVDRRRGRLLLRHPDRGLLRVPRRRRGCAARTRAPRWRSARSRSSRS